MQQRFPAKSLPRPVEQQGGLTVRTGLRGGVCVDVSDEVKAALETLTTALGGAPTIVSAPPVATTTPSTISS